MQTQVYSCVLCSQGGTSAVTVAGGEGRAVSLWWSRSESSAKQEPAPVPSSDGDAQMIERAKTISEGFQGGHPRHINRSPCSTCAVGSGSWGCYCSSNELHSSHHPFSVSAPRVFIFTISGWKFIFSWSWNCLDKAFISLQNIPSLGAFHFQHCLLWFFRLAEENHRCIQVAGIFTWILVAEVAGVLGCNWVRNNRKARSYTLGTAPQSSRFWQWGNPPHSVYL